jgi:hypothetical protein
MNDDIPDALRVLIQSRAGNRCEYCLLHEDDAWEPHQPDHIIAKKHRGKAIEGNLAWTCALCNRHKGSDIASIDRDSERIVRLYHPRKDAWSRHFLIQGGVIRPRTSVARVTEFLLQLNRLDRVRVRHILAKKGLYPR